jgi:Lar family restriction alleviation protein
MSDKLKPCPFCGEEAYLKDEAQTNSSAKCPPSIYRAVCSGCEVRTDFYYKPEEAAGVWNTRAGESA